MDNINPTPPRFFLRFFRWFCHPDIQQYIEGDLMELYEERIKEYGKREADKKFIRDVMLLFRPGIIKPAKGFEKFNQHIMLSNYFKIGIRNIIKYKAFSFINVFGLALAMSVCMLIILMLNDQKSYDTFHDKKDRIFRILSKTAGGSQPYATTPYPLASTLKADYPIIEKSVGLTPGVGGDAYNQEKVSEIRGYFTDPAFFDVFSFKLLEGNIDKALSDPYSMVISLETAKKLFGNENPIGKTVEFYDRKLSFPIETSGSGAAPVLWGSFMITGIIDQAQYRSHLDFDILISSSTRPSLYAEEKLMDQRNDWEWYYRTYTYVLLKKDYDVTDLNSTLNNLVDNKYAGIEKEQLKGFSLAGQKLSDIQLGLMSNDTNSRMPLIGYYGLSFLAAIIMILACLNYTNLSIARALTRAKEIGVRKVTGASKKALVFQFLFESILLSLIALVMAYHMLFLIKPAFKSLWINNYLNFELQETTFVYLLFIIFAIVIGIIAGLYPALHLSTYKPIKALKNLNNIRPGKLRLRKILTISQFVVSLLFITTSILIFNQFKHYMDFDYGFSSKNIVNVELQGADYWQLANEMNSVPGVTMISATNLIPATNENNNTTVKIIGAENEYSTMGELVVDHNFIDNLQVKVVAGKNFSVSGQSPEDNILINVDAVAALGYQDPHEIIGVLLETKWDPKPLQVIGVVENFKYKQLISKERGALMLRQQPEAFKYLNVKIAGDDIMGTVSLMKDKWKKIDPVHPFRYGFFEDQIASSHKGIFDLVKILGFLTFLAITIACFGMLGMTLFTAERKVKEVGIRKILGAPNGNIAYMLSFQFLKVLFISICIGAPLSYFMNNLWLQYLPNRVDFGLGTVIISTIILLLFGSLSILSQTFRASKVNPVEALKME